VVFPNRDYSKTSGRDSFPIRKFSIGTSVSMLSCTSQNLIIIPFPELMAFAWQNKKIPRALKSIYIKKTIYLSQEKDV